ncbi:hypothetical protein ACFV4P_21850 [Kitasatospora sp. NPDC059795]|uniref:hypothetical protein n=1 Tax=Kitasatospora sp. NPDC059795 TaxID=3346949 RepID=UPI00364C1F70
MRTRRQWPARAVLAGLVVLGMAGVVSVASCEPDRADESDPAAVPDNGLEALTAGEILDKARGAGADVASLRGTVRTKQESGTVEYSLSVARNGDCTGTVSEGGVEAEVLRQGGTVWVKPSAAMLPQLLPDAGPDLADKWLAGTGELGRRYGGYCDLVFGTATAGGPFKPADEATEWTTTGVRPVSGAPAVFLAFRSGGGGEHARFGTVAIAADGPPYLLSVDETGDSAVAMRFDAFGEPVDVAPPPADAIADASGRRIVLDPPR